MREPPFNVIKKLIPLEQEFLSLIKALTKEEWQAQTIARLWKVKDVVAHLLDGNIRSISMLRDGYFGSSPNVNSYQELVDYLNQLNADWVKAMNRVSPSMLILLHEITGPIYYRYHASLDPFEKSVFSVAWAGESESKNWMHLAREYTEKFLHQMQIRDAVNKPGIMTREFFYPFADICMLALPYTFRDVDAPIGTCVKMKISSEIGGEWYLTQINKNWELNKELSEAVNAEVIIGPNEFWKLVSKSKRYSDFKEKIQIKGDKALAEKALAMVSFMA